jgi:hypothetical protein
MKFLAFTAEDQGVIIDANDWDDAKIQLKKRLTKNSFLNEVKLLNLADGTERMFIPNIKQQGGSNVEELYTIARDMNNSTKKLVEFLKNKEEQKEGSGITEAITNNRYITEPDHPQCTIM